MSRSTPNLGLTPPIISSSSVSSDDTRTLTKWVKSKLVGPRKGSIAHLLYCLRKFVNVKQDSATIRYKSCMKFIKWSRKLETDENSETLAALNSVLSDITRQDPVLVARCTRLIDSLEELGEMQQYREALSHDLAETNRQCAQLQLSRGQLPAGQLEGLKGYTTQLLTARQSVDFNLRQRLNEITHLAIVELAGVLQEHSNASLKRCKKVRELLDNF